MDLKLSRFGNKLARHSGILALMDDLGKALATGTGVCMMGGGNPARVPEVERIWRRRMREILDEGDVFERMLANYDTPQGQARFIATLADYFNAQYGWNLTPANIAITNGSQLAFFCLFNMFAGEQDDGGRRRILLPLAPEYIGYADQGLSEGMFASYRPEIEFLDNDRFKYHVDFDHLVIDDGVGAICVSRPTNPTGNVLTDEEVRRLAALAERHRIPLIIDNAYGAPFPGILFTDIEPVWNDYVVLSMSLSKLGLPGTRTGIVIAHEDIVSALCSINSVVSLANGNIGQTIVEPLLRNGELSRISKEMIRPFYQQKAEQALEWIRESFAGVANVRVHKSEGALFLWLWFEGLPITTLELYHRLKQRNVIIVPGCYFFYGLDAPWKHADECLRLNYSQPEAQVREGIRILAEEVKRAR